MNPELQQQTDLILKALDTLHHDNQYAAIMRICIASFLALLVLITIIRR